MEDWSARTRETIHSMEIGDAAALAHGRGLAAALWERKGVEAPTEGLLPGFRDLLRRRGFFVASDSDFVLSLEEIQNLGEGFDLYDLARQLAALVTVLTECLKVSPRPLIPGLGPFAPPCPCGRHPLKSRL
jgi:hypothetical protein